MKTVEELKTALKATEDAERQMLLAEYDFLKAAMQEGGLKGTQLLLREGERISVVFKEGSGYKFDTLQIETLNEMRWEFSRSPIVSGLSTEDLNALVAGMRAQCLKLFEVKKRRINEAIVAVEAAHEAVRKL